MRQFGNVMRSRAVPILSGAVLAVLVVPATALATGFAEPTRRSPPRPQRAPEAHEGSEGLVIFLAVIAVFAVAVLFCRDPLASGEPSARAARAPGDDHPPQPSRHRFLTGCSAVQGAPGMARGEYRWHRAPQSAASAVIARSVALLGLAGWHTRRVMPVAAPASMATKRR